MGERIAVLGAGSWGTALASQLVRRGLEPVLWGRDPEALRRITTERVNPRYLPGIELPASIVCEPDLAHAVATADWLLLVPPSSAFGELCARLAPLLTGRGALGVAWATKGFEPGTGRFLHEVAAEALGPAHPLAVVTGPSFASEVARGLPTALVVAGFDQGFTTRVAHALHGHAMRAYTSADLLGAELGGAIKNVIAVATGIADGANAGLNARAALITRGLAEMMRLAARMGGRPETMIGLAGLGDLVLTATGDQSRNRRLGLALGRGESVDAAISSIGQVVESLLTSDEVMRLARRHEVEMPIAESVYRILHLGQPALATMAALLARDPKPEFPQRLGASD